MVGSPPLVRGGLDGGLTGHNVVRLTPARAGRTAGRRGRCGAGSAHPRSCGADVHEVCYAELEAGSPPLVRGGRPAEGLGLARDRLTPARAGRTAKPDTQLAQVQAHPRSCGADAANASSGRGIGGSPPLVRGGLAFGAAHTHNPGLTPARAGRTRPPTGPAPPARAHPRSCGADRSLTLRPTPDKGSPPLVRGGLGGCRRPARVGGLTPARAGRTTTTRGCRCRWTAHPRSCGADPPGRPGAR